jgi:aminoglycoside phosphotransferase (APT) family kinase protein
MLYPRFADWHKSSTSLLASGPVRPQEPGYGPIADPSSSGQVEEQITRYLARVLRISNIRCAGEPQELADGWETHTYRFRLHPDDALPARFCGPLIVRIYPGREGVGRARREHEVQRLVHRLGYPVPEPLLLVDSVRYFGGPFLVRSDAHGPTLLQALMDRPWQIWSAPGRMAGIHARMHRLPVPHFPSSAEPFLHRRLRKLRDLIEKHDLPAMKPGLDWLRRCRPAEPRNVSLLHLDFHPLNIIRTAAELVVLDWSEADVGDPHADVATTLMMMECMPLPRWMPLHLPRVAVGRWLLIRGYLRAYGRHRELDPNTLRYYRALAAFHRLCRYGQWLCAGPLTTGNKPSSLQYLTQAHCQTLERYFHKWTGVRIAL